MCEYKPQWVHAKSGDLMGQTKGFPLIEWIRVDLGSPKMAQLITEINDVEKGRPAI